MEEQYPLTCIPYPFPKLLQGTRGLPAADTATKAPRTKVPSAGTAQGMGLRWPMGKTFQFIKQIGKQVQGYCKVHRQRYQVMQAAPPSLPLPKTPGTPIPSTKASSSMSRDHITMISDLRHPQGSF